MPNPTTQHDTALEHLRIIRTLMERAHIYRAVSAPAALLGGLLALGLALYGIWEEYLLEAGSGSGNGFRGLELLLSWLVVLGISSCINLGLLMQESRSKGLPMVTDGLRMALRAVVPPLLTGGVLGICLIVFVQQVELAALVWIMCYGLALQATVSFAPRSIIRLARAFLIAGQVLTVIWFASKGPLLPVWNGAIASALLGTTFGIFHIAYAAAVFVGPAHKTANGPAPQVG